MIDNISIIIPISPNETAHEALLIDLEGCGAEIIISSEASRAKSMNMGAQKATRNFLWFLHADSHVKNVNFLHLKNAVKNNPNALHYFKLKFNRSDFISLNAIGANFRSKIFHLPFGDQGFCLSKENFNKLGGYIENTPYGEDVLLIRRAKEYKMSLNMLPSYIETSARKYQANGWLKTTLLHQYLLFKLLRKKI